VDTREAPGGDHERRPPRSRDRCLAIERLVVTSRRCRTGPFTMLPFCCARMPGAQRTGLGDRLHAEVVGWIAR